MPERIVLKDGRIIELTEKQRMAYYRIILLYAHNRSVIIGDHKPFRIKDVETDPKEILKITQQKLIHS